MHSKSLLWCAMFCWKMCLLSVIAVSSQKRKKIPSFMQALLEYMGSNDSTGSESVAAAEKNADLLTSRAGAGDPSAIPSVCRIFAALQYNTGKQIAIILNVLHIIRFIIPLETILQSAFWGFNYWQLDMCRCIRMVLDYLAFLFALCYQAVLRILLNTLFSYLFHQAREA